MESMTTLLCVLRVLWLLLLSLMATTEKTQVTVDGRASPLLMSQSKCWLPTDGTTWLACHRLNRGFPAPCGSTHRLNIFLNPELCFAVLISLQHNVPVAPLLSSCRLITRNPTFRYPLCSFWSWEKKTTKKINLCGNICHPWHRRRVLVFFFSIVIIWFQCDNVVSSRNPSELLLMWTEREKAVWDGSLSENHF